MKKLFTFGLFLLLGLLLRVLPAAAQPTADTYVRPYTAGFLYGCNMGYYGGAWNDATLAGRVQAAGGHTLRPFLPEHFLETWGYNVRVSTFAAYTGSQGMQELVCAIGEPSAAHRDGTIYAGTESSKLFANLYAPIWNANGTVNQQNYYAYYVYQLLQYYGDYVKVWEVVNEPDFGYNNAAWSTRAPLPEETLNTLAPFYHYVRMLRITWEVVKRYRPQAYVTPGGIGYTEYLDALLRYTDDPAGGAVTAAYPATGGAYFDMLSYHVYPSYYLRSWDNAISGFRYRRTSDYAAAEVIGHKNDMQAVLDRYGYNGTTHPAKPFIVTETNICRRTTDGWRLGSDEMQRNFTIKTLVLAQKNDIRQLHFFSVGESRTAPAAGTAINSNDEYGLMGLYENLNRDAPGQEALTPLGLGFKTTSLLLLGWQYDAARTAALALPAGVEGAAFGRQGAYTYVLWAKALTDATEYASVTYTFPAAWNMAGTPRYEWDYGRSGTRTTLGSASAALSGDPSFFVQPAAPLPVVLVAFAGQRLGPQVARLNWQTASERHNGSFTLEKSADGQRFVGLRTVAGRGSTSSATSYQLTDSAAVAAAYYRLAQRDYDGTTTYSAAVFVAGSAALAPLVAYPSPARQAVTVSFVAEAAGVARLELVDALGRSVRHWSADVLAGPNAVPVALEAVPPGPYLLRVRTGAAVRSTRLAIE